MYNYLNPDYSEMYDSDPDDDEGIDLEAPFDEALLEEHLEEQEQLKQAENMVTTSPFDSGSEKNNPWEQARSSSGWGSNWGVKNSNPTWNNWGNQSTGNSWNNWGNQSTGNSWNNWGNQNSTYVQGERQQIDRTKKVIFCNVLDCLVETYQSNGRPGLIPRGIYDIKFKFDVWDKLGCIGPEKVYAMVPRQVILASAGDSSWKALLNYIACSITEYLRLPALGCQIIAQSVNGQFDKNVISNVIKENSLVKNEILRIGINSGLSGQNDRDALAAKELGIDYVDLNQLINLYF